MYIYGFTFNNVPEAQGLIKIGQAKNNAEERIRQQISTMAPVLDVKIEFIVQVPDCLSDKAIHHKLKDLQVEWGGQEWFKCTATEVLTIICEMQTSMKETSITQSTLAKELLQSNELKEKIPEFIQLSQCINESNINLYRYIIENNYPIEKFRTIYDIIGSESSSKVQAILGLIQTDIDTELLQLISNILQGFKPKVINTLIALTEIVSNAEEFNELIQEIPKIIELMDGYPITLREICEVSHTLKIDGLKKIMELLEDIGVGLRNNPICEHKYGNSWSNKQPLTYNLCLLLEIYQSKDKYIQLLNDINQICGKENTIETLNKMEKQIKEWKKMIQKEKELQIKKEISTPIKSIKVGKDSVMQYGIYKDWQLSEIKKEDEKYWKWLKRNNLQMLADITYIDSITN